MRLTSYELVTGGRACALPIDSWTAPMAMPWMENVPHDSADAWLDSLVDAVESRPGAVNKAVFEVQGRDWRPSHANGDFGHVDSAVMAHWMKRIDRKSTRLNSSH